MTIFCEHANCEDTVSVISKYALYFEQNTWNLLYNIIQCPERMTYLRNAFQQNLQKYNLTLRWSDHHNY